MSVGGGNAWVGVGGVRASSYELGRWGGHEEPLATLVVAMDCFHMPPAGPKQRINGRGLAVAKFHGETTAWSKSEPEFLSKSAIECEAVPPAVERLNRIMIANLGIELGDFVTGDIGRIRHHQVESLVAGQRGATVAEQKSRPLSNHPQFFGVSTRQSQGGGREIDGSEAGQGGMEGDGQRQATRAGSPIQDFRRARTLAQPGPGPFGEQLGFWPGNEGGGADLKFQAAERGAPENVLEGHALAATPDGFPGDRELGFIEDPIEFEVQFKPGKFENVGQDQLDLEARGFDAALPEVGGAALDDINQPHSGQVALAGAESQT
jgi:hypothetical protein